MHNSFLLLSSRLSSALMKMYSSLLLPFFADCMLLNINFMMKIIKNASPAISNNIHKKRCTETTFHWMLHSHLLWVEHVCIYGCMMINVYLYLCMFVAVWKNIIYIARLRNWSATLRCSVSCKYTEGIKGRASSRSSCRPPSALFGVSDEIYWKN